MLEGDIFIIKFKDNFFRIYTCEYTSPYVKHLSSEAVYHLPINHSCGDSQVLGWMNHRITVAESEKTEMKAIHTFNDFYEDLCKLLRSKEGKLEAVRTSGIPISIKYNENNFIIWGRAGNSPSIMHGGSNSSYMLRKVGSFEFHPAERVLHWMDATIRLEARLTSAPPKYEVETQNSESLKTLLDAAVKEATLLKEKLEKAVDKVEHYEAYANRLSEAYHKMEADLGRARDLVTRKLGSDAWKNEVLS